VDATFSYMAIVSDRPRVLADFYAKHFDMWELGHSDDGDVSITDGHVNVSILKQRPGVEGAMGRPGLSHFGLAVQDIREVEGNLEEFGYDAEITAEAGDLHHGEYRVVGPSGLPISLSTRNFSVTEKPRSYPRIRHMALSFPKVSDDELDFLVNVFGIREVTLSKARRQQGRSSRFAGDGHINLALLAHGREFHAGMKPLEYKSEQARALDGKVGLNHFGFLVRDKAATMESLPAELRDVQHRSSTNVDMAEFRVYDPDFNAIDLAERGFEVDIDRWETADGVISTAERFAATPERAPKPA